MFRITEDPSSGSLVHYFAKNYRNDSIVSVDMDKVGVMYLCVCVYVCMYVCVFFYIYIYIYVCVCVCVCVCVHLPR